MSIYLDASVLVPRLVEERHSPIVDAFLGHCSEDLLISDCAAAEVASALSRLVRMRIHTAEEAAAALGDFEIWRVAAGSPAEIDAADIRLSYAHVRRFDLMLRAPDALHLAVARRLGATLATLDMRLANAARELDIAVVVPGADTTGDPS